MEDGCESPNVGHDKQKDSVVSRHRELYNKMLNCKDVDEFLRLSKEYAELDTRYERITNTDKLSVERCVRENEVVILK